MRLIAILAMISLSGCSWLFQDHETNPTSERGRRCTTTHRWWMLDGIAAASQAAAVLIEGSRANPNAILMSVEVAIGVAYSISGAEGYRWADECERSQPSLHYDSGRDGPAADRSLEATAPGTTPQQPPAGQHGLFCAGAGACARDAATCDEERNAALAAAPDLAVCAPAETAWCFDAAGDDERCFATRSGCTAAIADATTARGECEQRR